MRIYAVVWGHTHIQKRYRPDINARYIVPSIESSWKVEYYVSFKNSKGSEIRYWFLESELRKYSLQQERNSRIDQLLN